MSGLLRISRRFSRDCFLCLGGGLLLIAIGDLDGNLPDIYKYKDWPPSQVAEVYSTALRFGSWGAVFLVVAYALFKSKRSGPCVCAGVSACALIFLLLGLSGERSDPDFAIVALVPSIPMLLTLACGLGEILVGLKERGAVKSA